MLVYFLFLLCCYVSCVFVLPFGLVWRVGCVPVGGWGGGGGGGGGVGGGGFLHF